MTIIRAHRKHTQFQQLVCFNFNQLHLPFLKLKKDWKCSMYLSISFPFSSSIFFTFICAEHIRSFFCWILVILDLVWIHDSDSVSRSSPSELKSEKPESLKLSSSELLLFSIFWLIGLFLCVLLKHLSHVSDKEFLACWKSFLAHRLGLITVSMPEDCIIRALHTNDSLCDHLPTCPWLSSLLPPLSLAARQWLAAAIIWKYNLQILAHLSTLLLTSCWRSSLQAGSCK